MISINYFLDQCRKLDGPRVLSFGVRIRFRKNVNLEHYQKAEQYTVATLVAVKAMNFRNHGNVFIFQLSLVR